MLEKIKWQQASCLFCGEQAQKEFLFDACDYLHGVPGRFKLVRCDLCQLVFQDPRPDPEYIHFCYPDSASYYQESEEKSSIWKRRISDLVLAHFFGYGHLGRFSRIKKFFLWPIYFYLFRDQTIPKFIKNGRLLEIGCSYGYRLQKDKRRGWNVTGIELNNAAAESGREKRKLDIRTGSVYEIDFPAESFDAIVLDMVLEHVYDAHALLSRVEKWLKPQGELLFSIPYFEGFEFRWFQSNAYGVQLPTHLYFYNTDHLRQLLKNFEKIQFIWQHVDRDWVAGAAYRAAEKNHRIYKFIAKSKVLRWLVVKPLVFVFSLFGMTSRLTVRAIKRY